MDPKDEVRIKMAELVRSAGLPVGMGREMADSDYTLIVGSAEDVLRGGYALELDDVGKHLGGLSLVDLAYLIEHPIRGKDLDSLRRSVDEDNINFACEGE